MRIYKPRTAKRHEAAGSSVTRRIRMRDACANVYRKARNKGFTGYFYAQLNRK